MHASMNPFILRQSLLPLPGSRRLFFGALLACAAATSAQERRIVETILSDARSAAAEWRYTTAAPDPAWHEPGFDDLAWTSGYGGFGTPEVEGSVIGTSWTETDIWLRRAFMVEPGRFEEVTLSLHHDDDIEVYINGVQVLAEPGFTTGYAEVNLPAEAVAALKPGANVLAIHCANTGTGPQYVDAGLSGSRTMNVTVLSPDARIQAQEWKYVTADPGADWQAPAFPDEAWTVGAGGFGSADLYAAHVGSAWMDTDIWLRRTFTADKEYPEYLLSFHHDDDLEVYINGAPVLQRSGWTPDYMETVLTPGQAGIKAGVNVIAVHCANTGTGPQFVDVGLIGMAGKAPTRSGKGKALFRGRSPGAVLSAGGVLDISALGRGRAGRLEVFTLDGSLRASLGAEAGARSLDLPSHLRSGAYRYRWSSAGGRSEGRLIRLP